MRCGTNPALRTRAERRLPGSEIALLAIVLFASGRAQAQTAVASCPSVHAPPDDTLPRSNAFFDEGRRLLGEKRVAEACACFEESYRLAPRGGNLLNLGLCHEQAGRLLAARRELGEALAIARRDGRADREPLAREHIAAIEARLSWLELAPPPNVERALVTLAIDGAPLAPEHWSAVPVEPGTHLLSASADGFRASEVRIEIGPASERRSLRFAALEPLVRAPEPGKTAEFPVVPAPAVVGRDRYQHTATLRSAALIAGVAGLALSLGAGVWALERKGAVRDHCNSAKKCDDGGVSAASTGRALVITSTAAFAIGFVGFGAWFLLPGGALNQDAASAAGVAAGGSF